MSNTSYVLSPLFLFLCFSQNANNFRYTPETSPILLLLNCLSPNATKRLLVKLWNTNYKKHFPTAYQEMFNGNDSFCSISQFLNNFPRLTSLYFFSFPNWQLKLNCTIRWQQSGDFEKLTSSESWKFFFATNKLQNTLHAPVTLAIYPLMFAASIENPDSTTLTGKNTYCTTFWLCSSIRSGYYL